MTCIYSLHDCTPMRSRLLVALSAVLLFSLVTTVSAYVDLRLIRAAPHELDLPVRGRPHLSDREVDPHGFHNLAATEPARLKELRDRLQHEITRPISRQRAGATE